MNAGLTNEHLGRTFLPDEEREQKWISLYYLEVIRAEYNQRLGTL